MRSCVVFYSLQGSTVRLARAVAERLGSDTLELACVKPYPTKGPGRLAVGARDAIAGKAPALVPYAFDEHAYDLVIVGGPIWAGRMAAPLNTFVRDHDLSGARLAGLVVSGAPQAQYADAPRRLVGLDASMPVLHLTTKQVADDEALEGAVAGFCDGLSS